jgi:hypothetical protein
MNGDRPEDMLEPDPLCKIVGRDVIEFGWELAQGEG